MVALFPEFFGTYSGDAMHPGGGSGGPSENLIIPPNVAGVVLLSNGKYLTLKAGRHKLRNVLREGKQLIKPVSVQFVNRQRQSLHFDELIIHTREHMEVDIDLVVVAQVPIQTIEGDDGPQMIIELDDPYTFVRSLTLQELIKTLSSREHTDAVESLPRLLANDVLPNLNLACQKHGLRIDHVLLRHVHPDHSADEMEKNAALQRIKQDLEFQHKQANLRWRKSTVELETATQLLEAQMDEDVAALKQPGNRRRIGGELGGQARERNQAARMEAISAVQELAKAMLEQMHKYPGRAFTPEDTSALLKALELLDKLADPDRYKAPPIPQQMRSTYAVDENQPKPPELTSN
jgi:hypothetical protein